MSLRSSVRTRVMSESGRTSSCAGSARVATISTTCWYSRVRPRGQLLLIKKRALSIQQASLIPSSGVLRIWTCGFGSSGNSGMPYFWGNSAYLLDTRIRPGSISRDVRIRFESLDTVISEYASRLRHHSKGMAYVRAAVSRTGPVTTILHNAGRSSPNRQVCAGSLLTPDGLRLLGWDALGPVQGNRLRRCSLIGSLGHWTCDGGGGCPQKARCRLSRCPTGRLSFV